jgi:hypothetical protein
LIPAAQVAGRSSATRGRDGSGRSLAPETVTPVPWPCQRETRDSDTETESIQYRARSMAAPRAATRERSRERDRQADTARRASAGSVCDLGLRSMIIARPISVIAQRTAEFVCVHRIESSCEDLGANRPSYKSQVSMARCEYGNPHTCYGTRNYKAAKKPAGFLNRGPRCHVYREQSWNARSSSQERAPSIARCTWSHSNSRRFQTDKGLPSPNASARGGMPLLFLLVRLNMRERLRAKFGRPLPPDPCGKNFEPLRCILPFSASLLPTLCLSSSSNGFGSFDITSGDT